MNLGTIEPAPFTGRRSRRGRTGNSRQLNDELFRESKHKRARRWAVVNNADEVVGRFFKNEHAIDWIAESGEVDAYSVEKGR